uniref:SLC26A/SulP transporter domain-containing protein n=1 Tax=Hucho hucho TaxID=62062 RepID=A0A4W5L540_9TELE
MMNRINLTEMVLGVVKFVFVGIYLSEPLVLAYTTAAAAHAVVSVITQLFGVSTTRFSGPLSLVYTLVEVCTKLPQTHLPTLLVSGVSMVFLIAKKEINVCRQCPTARAQPSGSHHTSVVEQLRAGSVLL